MITVQFRKQIHGCFAAASSEDVWLFRDVELPFTPCVGLTVEHGDFSETIGELIWRVDSQRFVAYAEPDKTLYDRALQARDFMGGKNGEGRKQALAIAHKEYVPDGWQIDVRNWWSDEDKAIPTDSPTNGEK